MVAVALLFTGTLFLIRNDRVEQITCNNGFVSGWFYTITLVDNIAHMANMGWVSGTDQQTYTIPEGTLCLHQTKSKRHM